VTSQPKPEVRIESWSAKGDVRELRSAFKGFDRQVETVLAACPDVHKWAIVDRNSLVRWADRNVTLLGDACHPMRLTWHKARPWRSKIRPCFRVASTAPIVTGSRMRFGGSRRAEWSGRRASSKTSGLRKEPTPIRFMDAWTVPLAA
jgi:6-hydroxynicotinate 3-monooxygenase